MAIDAELSSEIVELPAEIGAPRTRQAGAAALGEVDNLARWREWVAQLRVVFEAADRAWVAVDGVACARTGAKRRTAMIIGIGIDLVEIDRVERMLTSLGERMLARLFSEREAAYIRSRAAPAQHAAVRLAAKEAAFKALSGNELARGISWRDVEVVNDADGAPTPRALWSGGRAGGATRGVARVHVSLTTTNAEWRLRS